MTPRVERALLEAVSALDEVGLRYAIVGGLAVGVWALPRATRDVDLYAELPSTARDAFAQALVQRGFDVPAMADELRKFGVFRSRLKGAGVFVDVFDSVGPLGEAILHRRRKVVARGRELWFASPEDLALLKAFSDRPRDLDDLIALMSLPDGSLDAQYIDQWVKLLDDSIGGTDVSERLTEARRKAATNPER